MTTTTHTATRWSARYLCLALLACLLCGVPLAASQQVTAAGTPPPAPLVGMPATPTNQNAVALFRYARHFPRAGEKLTGRLTLSPTCREVHCYVGTDWTVAGAPAHACAPSALTCTWTVKAPIGAQPPAPQWIVARMPITTTTGVVESDDAYTVLPKGQFVLDGTVTNGIGGPYSGIALAVSGTKSGSIVADSNGYYSAFLPRGRYTVRVNAGSPRADSRFLPRARTLSLTDRGTAAFTGYAQTLITATQRTVEPNGLGVITMTVRVLNQLGQGVSQAQFRVTSNGPDALLCATAPTPGLVEPQDLLHGRPLSLPVRLQTDGTGSLTFQAFFGTQSGRWQMTATEASVLPTDHHAYLSIARATVTVAGGQWLAGIPTRLTATIWTKGVPRRETLTLPRLIWQALHGNTLNTPTPAATYPGGSDTRTILHWMETYLPLQGLELSPLSAAGGPASGVLIFTPRGRDTRVVDEAAFLAILQAPTMAGLPAQLPTLSAWQTQTGTRAVRDYAGTPPERGLTYNGFPYLPVNGDLYTAFENNCLQKAPGV